MPHKQAGFTVLELMVATSIFAVVLLVLTAGILGFSRDYFASIRRSNTQATARLVIDDISRSIRFSKVGDISSSSNSTTKAVCIGNVMYIYAIGLEVGNSDLAAHKNKYGLIKRTGCTATPDITDVASFHKDTDQELLATNMRISNLAISVPDPANSPETYVIKVRIAYGDDDLFGIPSAHDPANWATISCNSGVGTQFCAISDVSTTVQQRL